MFLLNTDAAQSAIGTTIARHCDESIRILGEDFDWDSVLSRMLPYMVKAARNPLYLPIKKNFEKFTDFMGHLDELAEMKMKF